MNKLFWIVLLIIAVACGGTVEPQTEQQVDIVSTQVAFTMEAMENATDIPAPTEAPTQLPQIGTRSNPVPFGQPFGLVYQNAANFQIILLEVIRGQDTATRITQANMFNDPAPEGMEYMIVKLGVNYQTSTQEDLLLNIDSFSFKSVSNNQILDYPAVVSPEPELSVNLFPGGYGEGYIVLLTYPEDPAPLVLYNEFLTTDMFYLSTIS